VSFDEICLANVLTNLLQNALKFTERGEVAVRLWRDAALCLQVRDTGVGIDANYLPHVFEAFSQENPGLTRRFEGVGLGLSLVRKYLALNGAEIAVASEKHRGSTFTIRFARDAADDN
jgi:signal transduction histidine kinase